MAFSAKTKTLVAGRVHHFITDDEYTTLVARLGVSDPEEVFQQLAPTVGFTEQQKLKTQTKVEALKKELAQPALPLNPTRGPVPAASPPPHVTQKEPEKESDGTDSPFLNRWMNN